MRSVPNAAVMFVTFEVASKWLLKKQIEQNKKDNENLNKEIPSISNSKLNRVLAMNYPVIKTNQLHSFLSR